MTLFSSVVAIVQVIDPNKRTDSISSPQKCLLSLFDRLDLYIGYILVSAAKKDKT